MAISVHLNYCYYCILKLWFVKNTRAIGREPTEISIKNFRKNVFNYGAIADIMLVDVKNLNNV